jgi:hypothetical protein
MCYIAKIMDGLTYMYMYLNTYIHVHVCTRDRNAMTTIIVFVSFFLSTFIYIYICTYLQARPYLHP